MKNKTNFFYFEKIHLFTIIKMTTHEDTHSEQEKFDKNRIIHINFNQDQGYPKILSFLINFPFSVHSFYNMF